MNEIFFHMADFKKHHPQNKTKTFETNITSEKGEEKSKSKSNSQTIYQNNPVPKKQINLYLIQYQKYFNKKLVIKYNILPNEYTLMKLDNFITAKYCHSLSSFKENLIFNYDEEFLNRFYSKKEAKKKIPLFAEFYKSYLKFFCFPTLSELKLNDLIEDMVEKKAKAFYNENFSEKNEKSEKKINVIIFTNKIRKDISRRNSLTNLTKTTIKNYTNTNKSSISLVTIEKIFNEMNNEKNNNNNKNNLKNENNSNSISKGIKNSVILKKIKKKIKIDVKDNNISNNTSKQIKNSNTIDYASSGKRKKIKNKISRTLQNKLLDNKYSTVNSKKASIVQKKINSILKMNSNINYNKIKYNNNPLENQRKLSTSKNNSKNLIESKNKEKESKQKQSSYNNNNIFSKKYCSTINNNFSIKNNTLISIFNNTTHKNSNINNNNINKNKNFNFIMHKTNSNTNNNSNIYKNIKKIIKKPSIQKIKSKNQTKSRNYNSINDTNVNSVYSTQIKNDLNNFMTKNETKENIYDYYTMNNKKINTVSIKISNQKSKPKIKLIKPDNNKININNNQNINDKVLKFINTRKNTNSNLNYKKENESSSTTLKFINEKKYNNNNIMKSKIVDSKNHIKINTKSYAIIDSQSIIKNLKIVANKENNSKNKINDCKVKINKKIND